MSDAELEWAAACEELEAALDRVREQLVASAALSDGVMEYTSLAPRPRDLRAAWQLVAIGVQVELDARARAARTPHSRAPRRALAKRWDRHVSVVDATWEACS